jgi:hypothetical protein
MTMARCASIAIRCWLTGLVLLLSLPGRAEPYLAVEQGLKCIACHVNPTGGGLRNAAGTAFSQYSLPAHRLPDAMRGWSGAIGSHLRIGADLRTARTVTSVPGSSSQKNTGLEQWRLYGDLQLIPDRVGVYIDEQMGPGQRITQERYVRLSTAGLGWYLKAGQFYLPFGWRLQDNSTFVRQASGINMNAPDKGIELGLERDAWSAQLVYSNGPGNVGSVTGHQVTAQVVWVQRWGRIGAATASVASSAGDRQVNGLFAGLHTGRFVWLGEIDAVSDAGYPEGRRRLLAALGEVNWRIGPGLNLKLTGEHLDPDRRVPHDNRVRSSLVLEYSPIPFLQLRSGVRRYRGIPQSPVDNRTFGFIELHGMF